MCDSRSHNQAIARIKAKNFYTPPVNEPQFINPFLLKSDTEAINEILQHLIEGEAIELANKPPSDELPGLTPTDMADPDTDLNPTGMADPDTDLTGLTPSDNTHANAHRDTDPNAGREGGATTATPSGHLTSGDGLNPTGPTGQAPSSGGTLVVPLNPDAGKPQPPSSELIPTGVDSGNANQSPDDEIPPGGDFAYPLYGDVPINYDPDPAGPSNNVTPSNPDSTPTQPTNQPTAGVDSGGANSSPDEPPVYVDHNMEHLQQSQDPTSVADFDQASRGDSGRREEEGGTIIHNADGSSKNANIERDGLEHTASRLREGDQFTYQGNRYSMNAQGGTSIKATNYNPDDVNTSLLVMDSAGNYKLPSISSIKEWTTENPAFDENGRPATRVTLTADGSRYKIYYGGDENPSKYIDRPDDGKPHSANIQNYLRNTDPDPPDEPHPQPSEQPAQLPDPGPNKAWMVRADGSKSKIVFSPPGQGNPEYEISTAVNDLNSGDSFTKDGVSYSISNSGTKVASGANGILLNGKIPPLWDLNAEERGSDLNTWRNLPLTKIERKADGVYYYYGNDPNWGNKITRPDPSPKAPSSTLDQVTDAVRKADDILSGGSTNFASQGGSGFNNNINNYGGPDSSMLYYP